MLTTLTRTPTLLVTLSQQRPVFRARWITATPHKSTQHHTLSVQAMGPYLSLRGPDWMKAGLCAQLPQTRADSLFFGIEHREAPGALIAAVNAARKICNQCPVEARCLTNALLSDERYGVWGGTSGRQRSKLRARLAAGEDIDDLVTECLSSS